jgi:simple sugar transport system permease protein
MMEVLASIVSIEFVQQALYVSIPFVLGALGACVTERAGVVDLAVEAKLSFGAFFAVVAAHAAIGLGETGAIVVGLVGGAAAGAAVALVQGGCAVGLRADHVIVGIALNIVALGGTRFLLQVLYGESANSPTVPSTGDGLVGNPMAWLALVAALALPWAFLRTRAGLRIRAAGDRPDALAAAGVSITRTRLLALAVGGALAGAGGAHLSLSVGVFHAETSGGRGYMALAAVILAGWRPGRAALACLAFAAADAINSHLQLHDTAIPRELAQLFPYLITLVVLAVWGAGRLPPRALGKS